MNPAARGRFVWFEVMTRDLEKTKAFYSEIAGWKFAPFGGESTYELMSAGEKQVGAVMPVGPGEQPRWLGYIATDDVDGTTQRTQKMRGKVITPPKDIPDVGRYAVLTDPQGAELGLYDSKHNGSAPDPMALGQIGWNELNTTDWKSAWQFYSELFGWKEVSSMPMGGDLGDYFIFGPNPKDMFGGMSNAAKGMPKPAAHWLHYVNVQSADETAKRIVQIQGTVMNGPMDVPGGGRIAQCIDPQGAVFGIFSRK
jgi:predicted enzyme related to lactoylglutathione lyase